MAIYKLVWQDGKQELVQGPCFSEAFGEVYSFGAMQALDYYRPIEPPKEGWVKVSTEKRVGNTQVVYSHPWGLKKTTLVNQVGNVVYEQVTVYPQYRIK